MFRAPYWSRLTEMVYYGYYIFNHLINFWRAAGTFGQRGVKVVEQQPSLVCVAQTQGRHYAEDTAAKVLFQRQTGLRQLCKYQCTHFNKPIVYVRLYQSFPNNKIYLPKESNKFRFKWIYVESATSCLDTTPRLLHLYLLIWCDSLRRGWLTLSSPNLNSCIIQNALCYTICLIKGAFSNIAKIKCTPA